MGGGEAGGAFEANEGEPEAEEGDGADAETEQALAEFDFLVQQQDQQQERAGAAAGATAASTDSTDAVAGDENAAPHVAAPAAATEADSLSSLDALGECLHTFNETLSACDQIVLTFVNRWRVRRPLES